MPESASCGGGGVAAFFRGSFWGASLAGDASFLGGLLFGGLLGRGPSFFGGVLLGGLLFWRGASFPGGGSPWQRALLDRGLSLADPPMNRITHSCKNITLATTSLRPVMKSFTLCGCASSCSSIAAEKGFRTHSVWQRQWHHSKGCRSRIVNGPRRYRSN